MIDCPSCGEQNPPKFRLCGYCGTPLAPAAVLPAQEVRKTVTIVFSDLKSYTSLSERLDPEALHEVKKRYFAAMAREIERHGGRIEKYIGDAIMAVFGLPRAEEDDALRAVRAAAGMQAVLQGVNDELKVRFGTALVHRIGVNTGEVVANADLGSDNQKLATGDAVNVAARLQQAAPDDGTYLGETTYRLVRDAVEVEPVEPLELKGKARRLPAFRLLSAHGSDGNARRQDTPIVGRDEELDALQAMYRQACSSTAIRLATIIGDAGVGKSRLVRELIDRLGVGARVLRGRCLSYGDGITFWPLRQMLCQAADIREDDSPEAARAKLLSLTGDPDVEARLASAVGLSEVPFPIQELYWAARRALETVAASGPVVAFIDDIHWAQPAFLDLLEHVLDSASGVAVLLVTTARHDLIEQRPTWSERPGASRLVLRPLSHTESARVVANLLGSAGLAEAVGARIVAAAEGNPLYVEQMLSMLIDSGALQLRQDRWVRTDEYRDIVVPPTIQALLEARLDRLGRRERVTVEAASVVGLQFPQQAVESIAPEVVSGTVGEHLATLVHKRFVLPAPSPDTEQLYRFHHQLIRDTAYNGLLKRARATLHEKFVRWADRVNADRDRALEFEEILGYHLEQAHRCLADLGPLDEHGLGIGAEAAARLAGAGRRAFARGDMHAAANLYRRAGALLPQFDARRLALLIQLGETSMELGDFNGARVVLAEAEAAARQIASPRLETSARLISLLVRLHSGDPGGGWSEQTLALANEAIPMLEREGAHDELATAWRLIVGVHGVAGRYAEVVEAVEKAIAHARLAGDERLIARSAMPLATGALFGPTPVPQAIAQCERIVADGLIDRHAESILLCTTAQLRAMNGDFDQARVLYQRGRALLRDLGQGVTAASTGLDVARVELLAGDDLSNAEREVKADYELLVQMGETYFMSTMAALLARIVREQGRDAEALALSKSAEDNAATDDVEAQALWRAVRAPIIARSEDFVEAEALARAALEFARRTQAPGLQADTLADLASVLWLAGRNDEAQRTIGEAIALYEAKGDRVSAARSRTAWEREIRT